MYDLPPKIKGFILREDSGEEIVVLNSRLSHEANKEAYLHELKHKKYGDLDSKETVDTIESRAHDQ